MFAHVFKANPTGVNQYTKGKASERDLQNQYDALGGLLEQYEAKINKQKGGATPEQVAEMKKISAQRRALMKQIDPPVQKSEFPLPGRLGRFGG